jgi:hypothetical protein
MRAGPCSHTSSPSRSPPATVCCARCDASIAIVFCKRGSGLAELAKQHQPQPSGALTATYVAALATPGEARLTFCPQTANARRGRKGRKAATLLAMARRVCGDEDRCEEAAKVALEFEQRMQQVLCCGVV